MLSGTWDLASVSGRAPRDLRYEDFDAAMARQEDALRAALGSLDERDFLERRSTLPTGQTTNLGAVPVPPPPVGMAGRSAPMGTPPVYDCFTQSLARKISGS